MFQVARACLKKNNMVNKKDPSLGLGLGGYNFFLKLLHSA